MFGTSGIRDIYPEKINEKLALALGNAFAKGELYLARDLRKSGLSLAYAVAAGAMSAGAEVKDLGVASTGATAYYSKNRGIMITASHNPEHYNGFKFFDKKKEITKEIQEDILKRMRNFTHEKGGSISTSTVDEYIERLSGITQSQKTVVVDLYGAAGPITAKVLSAIGCRVITVRYPRPSEPRYFEFLDRVVREKQAAFGIAHDADGDRCVVIKGNIPKDAQLTSLIESGAYKKVVLTVEASLTVTERLKELGISYSMVPVGSVNVGAEMERNCFEFGGEPCGEYIFPEISYVPDGTRAAVAFLNVENFEYPTYPIYRTKFPVKDKDKAMSLICEQLNIENPEMRIEEEWGWYLIRPSGTEPVIRLTIEAKTRDELEKNKKKLEKIIRTTITRL